MDEKKNPYSAVILALPPALWKSGTTDAAMFALFAEAFAEQQQRIADLERRMDECEGD